MNNRGTRRAGYTALVWKVFLKILLIIAISIISVIVLRVLLQGSMGNWIVAFFQEFLHLDYNSAWELYFNVVRRNLDFIIYGAVAVVILILSRLVLSQFARYFNEISDGLDILGGDRVGEIRLSPEMSAMEQKLNAVRRTLSEREQEAKLAEQRKNDLVMYLAHDLKTPLTSVIGYLSLLDEAPDMPAEQKAKFVNITLEKAIRLEKLVDEFFEITRYSLQTISLSKKNIDLYYMLAQMADEFFPLFSLGNQTPVLRIPENLTVYGDPDHLARVFNNILKNALAYSPKGSEIGIEAEAASDMVFISFTNEGSIAKEKLESIFEKFYRLDQARSAGTGGAGLGLAIAKEIITLHGGNIRAESDEGRTTFIVELPGGVF